MKVGTCTSSRLFPGGGGGGGGGGVYEIIFCMHWLGYVSSQDWMLAKDVFRV